MKRSTFCLLCSRRLGKNDICTRCGGPWKITDRHVRRALRALRPLAPRFVHELDKRLVKCHT